MGCEKLKKCVALHFFIPNICRNKNFIYLCTRKRKQCNNAEVAQLVEHNLAKVRVAGSSPVFRSLPKGLVILRNSGAFYFMNQSVATTVTHKEEAILKLPNKRIRINLHFIIKHEKDICTTLTVLSDL